MKRSLLPIAALLLISLNIHAQEPANSLLVSWPQYLEHKANTPFKLNWISLGPVINLSCELSDFEISVNRPQI